EEDAGGGAARIARGGAARLAQGFAVTLANVARPGKSRRYTGGCPCGAHHVPEACQPMSESPKLTSAPSAAGRNGKPPLWHGVTMLEAALVGLLVASSILNY